MLSSQLKTIKHLSLIVLPFDWSSKQAYIVMANMMTMAAYEGLDSCALEGFNQDRMTAFLGDELGLFDTNRFGMPLWQPSVIATKNRTATKHAALWMKSFRLLNKNREAVRNENTFRTASLYVSRH